MTDLSPQAQAAWDAFNEDEAGVFVDYGDKLAAALRATIEHVRKSVRPHPAYSEPQLWAFYCGAGRMSTEILAIAKELENHS